MKFLFKSFQFFNEFLSNNNEHEEKMLVKSLPFDIFQFSIGLIFDNKEQ